ISADHEFWFRHHTGREPKNDDFFHADARADYIAALANPETVRGICEDYRAATSIDLEHDRESRARGLKITCPLLVLWGNKAKIEQWYDALAIWRDYASGPVTGHAVRSGHYLAEEAPEEVIAAVKTFLNL
ncbi:alpha/beta hydrolase, partial [Candidatus Saccharibacteria bacterium]|nr:alpha/beta hydrolase [Candidatus Saccharibacteria bacterium]